MVITVTCPSCSSSFPVDPAKIPERGVNVRCTRCAEIFRVERPREEAPEPVMELPEITPLESAPTPSETAAGRQQRDVDHDEPEEPDTPQLAPGFQQPSGHRDPFGQAAPFERSAPVEEEEEEAEPAAPAPSQPVQAFTFGKRDPTDKAKRLARVLVSDMIMYNAERHQSALASGTLVQDFEDEIEKSWKEFVDQVGDDLANGPGRGFWTEALNDILARGQKVF